MPSMPETLSAASVLENPGRLIPEAWLESREALEAGCREQTATQGDWCRVLGSWWLCPNLDDASLSPHLREDGFWESWVTLALARYIQPGMTCVDVGANYGYFTVLFADRVGESGTVIAVEPQATCVERLREALSYNKVSLRCWVDQVALSDGDGDGELLSFGDLHGSASLYEARGYAITGAVGVTVTTLDRLLRGQPVDVVKIDAEGAEAAIWDGMIKTREQNPQLAVCMEVCSERHYDLSAFLRKIERDGFPLRIVTDMGDVVEASLDEIMDRGEELPILWLQR